MKLAPAALLLLLVPSVFAQTTPVLIPVFYNGAGAFGSDWFTSVAVNNFSSQTIEGRGLALIVRCPIPEGCFADDFEPGAVGFVAGPQLPMGFLLHLPSGEAGEIELDARFGEVDRNRYGVELPIAREDDFRREPIVLPYVALTGAQAHELRTAVRVYSPDAISGQRVRIELRPWGSRSTFDPQASRDFTLALSDPPGTLRPLRPAFAMIELQREFPDIFSGAISVRIVPLPLPGGTVPRIWAMATAVRSDNNEVALYSPR